MDETREGCLAAILARGLVRVRHAAERTGRWKTQANDEPQPTAAEVPGAQDAPTEPPAAGNQPGEQP